MGEFQPSAIDSRTMLLGLFSSGKQELVAMCVTNYLANSKATWDTEFSWQSFANWLDGNHGGDLNELYHNMFHMFGGKIVITGIHELIGRGYISHRDSGDASYFTVTSSFVDAMRPYAP